MNKSNYFYASLSEEASIRSLLTECGLPHEDILNTNLNNFILVKEDNNLIGLIGLELYKELGLLALCV